MNLDACEKLEAEFWFEMWESFLNDWKSTYTVCEEAHNRTTEKYRRNSI